MTQEVVTKIVADAIFTIIKVSAPPLIMGLAVGLIVSIFQTITSIQEATLAFVPKILAVLLALILFGNWMLIQLQEFFVELLSAFPEFL